MDKVNFYGSIWTGDHEVVAALIEQWLGVPKVKIRLSGEEIVYEDPSRYVYCYNAVDVEGVGPSFLLEGHVEGSPDEARELLERLAKACQDRGIKCSFDYVQVDSDGEQIGEEHHLE